MLKWAIFFLIISLIATLLGFKGIASVSATIAKVIFGILIAIFIILFICFLVIAIMIF